MSRNYANPPLETILSTDLCWNRLDLLMHYKDLDLERYQEKGRSYKNRNKLDLVRNILVSRDKGDGDLNC